MATSLPRIVLPEHGLMPCVSLPRCRFPSNERPALHENCPRGTPLPLCGASLAPPRSGGPGRSAGPVRRPELQHARTTSRAAGRSRAASSSSRRRARSGSSRTGSPSRRPSSTSAPTCYINEGGCECGLFSMAFAPDYASSGRFYVFYTRDVSPAPSTTCGSRSSGARRPTRTSPIPPPGGSCWRSRTWTPATTTAASSSSAPTASSTSGSATAGTPGNAQTSTACSGKILRIDPRGAAPFQYSIPADNPFAGPGRRPRRDLRVGPAQPLPRLLRPLHGRPHHRRRRRRAAGGDRLQARGRGPGRQLRLALLRGDAGARRAAPSRTTRRRSTSTRTAAPARRSTAAS